MVATIIPVCSSSLLQDDTSVVPSFDLNHSPGDVPRLILDPVSTNTTIHPEELFNFNYVLSRELSLSPTSFSFLAIKQCNELPNDIKSINDFRVFKRRIKEFFISQYD